MSRANVWSSQSPQVRDIPFEKRAGSRCVPAAFVTWSRLSTGEVVNVSCFLPSSELSGRRLSIYSISWRREQNPGKFRNSPTTRGARVIIIASSPYQRQCTYSIYPPGAYAALAERFARANPPKNFTMPSLFTRLRRRAFTVSNPAPPPRGLSAFSRIPSENTAFYWGNENQQALLLFQGQLTEDTVLRK